MPPFPRLLLPLILAAASWEACAADAVLPLKPSSRLSPSSPAPTGPTHVEADRLQGQEGQAFEAEGQVIMRNPRETVEADWLRYDQPADAAHAKGNVLLTQDRNLVRGSELKLKLTERLGAMQDVRFDLTSEDGKKAYGSAKTLTFAGPDKYQLEQASYTTCAPNGEPDWQLKTDDLKLDYVASVGSARQVRVEFMDTPILYAPWMDFALDDKRKSGFLAPTYGASSERGLELITPWYWNIAPNRDATIFPRVMTKRGVQLGGEYRYLERDYSGELVAEALADDREANRDRWRGFWRHEQRFGERWSAALEFEKVSDDRYFAELSNLVSQTSRVNLPRQVNVNYDGGWWRAAGLFQRFQTLQDPAAPIVEPYHRVPQLTLAASRDNLLVRDSHLEFAGEYVFFDHQAGSRVQGGRLHAYPRLSLPFETPYSTVTPKLGLHLTRYSLDDASRNLPDSAGPSAPAAGYADANRALPVFSLDSSLVMERDWAFLGRELIQTLEPRAYYVYIPYRDQSRIPVFDSGVSDLSLDQLFTENQFTGVDRVNDANQMTLALTSRFLDRETGAERLQVTVGQRYYFTDQRVTLTPSTAPRSGDSTDIIAIVAGQLTPKLRISSSFQIQTDSGEVVKANFGGSWRDGPGRVFNADYRYTQDSINQVDLSFQWPLKPKWYGLGRLNYSLEDARLVEGLAGFEYNAGCWSLRGVVQQLATTADTATSAFFLQLELRGLTKLGPNPLDVLKRSISGYAKSDEFNLP